MLTYTTAQHRALLTDPVMAAKVILGYDLDTFQARRLREYWWVPETIDSSGISTGKTLTNFIYLNLRCILLPDHWALIYFPTFSVGRDEFWPYFDKTIAQSPVFAAQLMPHHGKLGEHKNPGTWQMSYKSGSRLQMPSTMATQDSKNNASRRANTVMFEEWLKTVEMGDSIDKQLYDRGTREAYSKSHPIWSNHWKFLGHAGSPSHKGFRRYSKTGRAIRDGSTRFARVSYCYKDMSPPFAKRLHNDHVTEGAKSNLTLAEFRNQHLGLWAADGEGVYPEVSLLAAKDARLRPETAAAAGDPNAYYFLGDDTALSGGQKADFAAKVVLKARIVSGPAEGANYRLGEGDRAVWFHLSFVFARALRGRTPKQLAGFTYFLHRCFGFSRVVYDPGGGGIAVYAAMQEKEQTHDTDTFTVTPLCHSQEPQAWERQAILTPAALGWEIDPIVDRQYLRGAEGIIDAMHRAFAAAWVSRSIACPPDLDDLSPREIHALSRDEQVLMKELTTMRAELQNVRAKVGKNSQRLLSSKGFTMYEARAGKKDRAYAALYAYTAFRIWAAQFAGEQAGAEAGDLVCCA